MNKSKPDQSTVKPNDSQSTDQFEDQPQLTLLQEIVEFIVMYKKWWLIPIVCSLGLIGLLAILAASGAAPFIYTVF